MKEFSDTEGVLALRHARRHPLVLLSVMRATRMGRGGLKPHALPPGDEEVSDDEVNELVKEEMAEADSALGELQREERNLTDYIEDKQDLILELERSRQQVHPYLSRTEHSTFRDIGFFSFFFLLRGGVGFF